MQSGIIWQISEHQLLNMIFIQRYVNAILWELGQFIVISC